MDIVGSLAIIDAGGALAALMTRSFTAAPPANEGCQSTYLGWNNGRTICDGPQRADGSCDRCLYAGAGRFGGGTSNCFPVWPDNVPFGQASHVYGPSMPGVPTNGFGI